VDPKVVLWIFTHLDIGRVVDGVVAVEELHRVLFVLMVLDHQTEEPKEMHVRKCEETRMHITALRGSNIARSIANICALASAPTPPTSICANPLPLASAPTPSH
jgi:hypothetical protein